MLYLWLPIESNKISSNKKKNIKKYKFSNMWLRIYYKFTNIIVVYLVDSKDCVIIQFKCCNSTYKTHIWGQYKIYQDYEIKNDKNIKGI